MRTDVPPSVLASTGARVAAGAAAGIVLMVGFLLRPATPVPVSAIEERPAPILEQVVSRRDAVTLVRRLQEVASQNARFSARISAPAPALERWSDSDQDTPPRDRYASIIDADRLVGRVGDLREGTRLDVVLGDGRRLAGSVGPHLGPSGLAFVDLDTPESLPVPPKAASVAPGDAVVATAPGVNSPLVVPLFVAGLDDGTVRLTTAVDGFEAMPVFHQDGGFVGIIARGRSGTRVLPLQAALAATANPLPQSRLGVTLAVQSTGNGGVEIAITDVAPDGFVARAGLRPGDILIAIDGEPLGALEDAAARLMRAGEENPLRVRARRGRRTIVERRIPAPAGPGR